MIKFKKAIAAVTCAAMTAAYCPASFLIEAADSTEEEQQFCAPISEVVTDSGLDIDYARALQYSLYFYDANMCGEFKENENKLSWRGSCHTYDAHVPMIEWDKVTTKSSKGGTNLSAEFMEKYKDILDPDGDGTIDVSGGFHDAGDHVEFGMPENYTAATLGWGYYEYRDVYKKLKQDDHIETILRHFNDYLMRCTFIDDNGEVIAHCYQVGEGNIDHAIWNNPEVDTMPRPAFFLTADKPQIDYAVSAAASLAINYLNFKDTDKEYAEKSLEYAKALWKFSNDAIERLGGSVSAGGKGAVDKLLSDNADGPVQFYQSTKWEDDYCWAAAWMYQVTGDESCFDYAVKIFDYYAASGWCYCWNDMWSGASVMWAITNQQHPELDLVQKVRDAQGKNQYVFDDFWDNDCVGKCLKTWQGLESPGGFAFLSQWGSCRYNTAMQMICLLYDKYKNNGKPSEWSEWAKKQMNYVLGDNDIKFKEEPKFSVLAGKNGTHGKRAFIVGYNDTAVKNPHHRAASGLLMAEDAREQRHILWGALAGGPDGKDGHDDATKDWTENEVTIDYNACLPAAAAGLYAIYGTEDMAVTPNFPPEDEKRVYGSGSDSNGGSGYWVEAIAYDVLNDDGTGATNVSFKVLSGESSPSKNISIRYYFNVSENDKPDLYEVKQLFDQSSTEDGAVGADGIASGPHKYDKVPDTYYAEISWKDYVIANSGKKYQFSVGFFGKGYTDSSTNKWIFYKFDPKNDYSYGELKMGKDTDFFAVDDPPEERTDRICVYADGVLVGGIEPDGSTPVKDEPAAPTTTTTKKPTVTTTTATKSPVATTTTTANGPKVENDAYLAGDANLDAKVSVGDAVAILQALGNKDKYALKPQGVKNADVIGGGDGVTGADALAIQKYDAKQYKTLPVNQ